MNTLKYCRTPSSMYKKLYQLHNAVMAAYRDWGQQLSTEDVHNVTQLQYLHCSLDLGNKNVLLYNSIEVSFYFLQRCSNLMIAQSMLSSEGPLPGPTPS